jgi:hypothetical protein
MLALHVWPHLHRSIKAKDLVGIIDQQIEMLEEIST